MLLMIRRAGGDRHSGREAPRLRRPEPVPSSRSREREPLDGASPLIHAARAGLVGAGALTLAACAADDIRTYDAPKDPVVTAAPAASHSFSEPSWTLPEGWEEHAGSGMRYATIHLGPPEARLEMRVTPLGLGARDPLANVNVWRGQLGLGTIEASELDRYVRAVTVDGAERYLVDLGGPGVGGGPPERMLAAIVPAADRAWFFVLHDADSRVEPHVAEFEEFILGVRMEEGAPSGPPPVASAPPAPSASESMVWTLPDGWTPAAEAPGSMRVATFRSSASPRVEVTITRFPGSVGGLLANVNRWRGQLGLDPVGDLAAQPLGSLVVAGEPARLLELEGAGENPERMRVLIAERPALTWFVKMTGPDDEMASESERFDALVRSIEFREATSG